jgi:segregation and condensation protein B
MSRLRLLTRGMRRLMNETHIRNVIEAAMLAAGKPLQPAELVELFDEGARPQVQDIHAALAALTAEYANRGIEIKETAAGFRIQVRREMANEVSRLWPERPAKYSRALLETLALIAYRQPITRAEIEAVRGVAVNPNILKTVIERNWVRVVGHRDVPGRPELLGTTRDFLDYFGLKNLDELPPLAELKTLGDIKVQFDLPDAGSLAEPTDANAAAGAVAAANPSDPATAETAVAAAAIAAGTTVAVGGDGANPSAGADVGAAVEAISRAVEGQDDAGAEVTDGADAEVSDDVRAEVTDGADAEVSNDVRAEVTDGADAEVRDSDGADVNDGANAAFVARAEVTGGADVEVASPVQVADGVREDVTDSAAGEVKAEAVHVNDAARRDGAGGALQEAEEFAAAVDAELANSDDDGSEDDELSAAGPTSSELVAGPRDIDD